MGLHHVDDLASLGWRTPIRVGTDRRCCPGRCGSRNRSAGRRPRWPDPRRDRSAISLSMRSIEEVPPAVLMRLPSTDEDRFRQDHLVEFLGEAVVVLPVDRGAAAVEQARPWPAPACRCRGAEGQPAARSRAGASSSAAWWSRRARDAAADDHGVVAAELGQIAVELEDHACRGRRPCRRLRRRAARCRAGGPPCGWRSAGIRSRRRS